MIIFCTDYWGMIIFFKILPAPLDNGPYLNKDTV